MSKFVVGAILFQLLINPAISQNSIDARLEFNYTSNTEFGDEWQYLTTDIYMFNGHKFKNVINKLTDKRGRGRNKNHYEQLLVTATLNDVDLFGKKELLYPLYNFQVTRNSKDEYETHVSENVGMLRLIDKFPLASVETNIDAKINVEAVPDSRITDILSVFTSQLQNISDFTDPTDAVLTLVGEYAAFIESCTQKKEYKFSSTIRLYDTQSFDMRLHSVKIYVLVPSDTRKVYVNTYKIKSFFQNNNNPEINREVLENTINHSVYPYLVVVNYKSLYKLEKLTGDRINDETLNNRKNEIEKDYSSNLLKDELYKHEKYYLEFLESFNSLKKSINIYSINYRVHNNNALPVDFFHIIQDYYNFCSLYNSRLQSFNYNGTFLKLFKAGYDDIFTYANSVLEKDANLRNCRCFVTTLFELNKVPANKLKQEQRETYLEKLCAVKLPDPGFLENSAEGQIINKHFFELEKAQYESEFAKSVDVLRKAQVNSRADKLAERLKMQIDKTYCILCRKKATDAIKNYEERCARDRINRIKQQTDSLILIANEEILTYFKYRDCANEKIHNVDINSEIGSGKEYIKTRLQTLSEKMDKLSELLRKQYSEYSETEILNQYNTIKNLMADIKQGYSTICNKYPVLCNCSE